MSLVKQAFFERYANAVSVVSNPLHLTPPKSCFLDISSFFDGSDTGSEKRIFRLFLHFAPRTCSLEFDEDHYLLPFAQGNKMTPFCLIKEEWFYYRITNIKRKGSSREEQKSN